MNADGEVKVLFPRTQPHRGRHALRDLTRVWTDDVVADPQYDPLSQFGKERAKDHFLGFNDDGSENWMYGPDERKGVYAPTGVM